MKTFCILEQGGNIGDALTEEHKKQFNTEYSDFYRLNWKTDKDTNAFVTDTNCIWSEGRSLLYDKVPKNYDYYIFIDDDVKFHEEDVALKIKELLEEYKPITGTFLDYFKSVIQEESGKVRSYLSWHFRNMKDKIESRGKKVFPIAMYDLACQIFSKEYASCMFPVTHHGGNRSLWYAQYVCHKLYPRKNLCFTEVEITNTRTVPHEYDTKKHYTELEAQVASKIVDKFAKDLYDPEDFSRLNKKELIYELNRNLYDEEADKTFIDFNVDDLATIYNVDNEDYKSRSAKVKQNASID